MAKPVKTSHFSSKLVPSSRAKNARHFAEPRRLVERGRCGRTGRGFLTPRATISDLRWRGGIHQWGYFKMDGLEWKITHIYIYIYGNRWKPYVLILRWSDLGSFGDTLHDFLETSKPWMTIFGIFMAHFALLFMNWWGGAPIEPIPPEQTSPQLQAMAQWLGKKRDYSHQTPENNHQT